MNITDLKPQIIAGFELAAYKTATGYQVGNEIWEEFPETITCNGVEYTLEYVDILNEKTGFCNAVYA